MYGVYEEYNSLVKLWTCMGVYIGQYFTGWNKQILIKVLMQRDITPIFHDCIIKKIQNDYSSSFNVWYANYLHYDVKLHNGFQKKIDVKIDVKKKMTSKWLSEKNSNSYTEKF